MDIPLADLFAKARVYIKDPSDAPTGANVQRGPQGGYYYDDAGKGGEKEEVSRDPSQAVAPEEQEQQLMEPEEWEDADAVQQQATNIMENNQGIPEEGSSDRQALNQMVARMSELTGQDPHEIAAELTQQAEGQFGGPDMDEETYGSFYEDGEEYGEPSEDWSTDSEIQDPRSPSYEVSTQSLSNSLDEMLHGRYSQLYMHPERKATERKWLERLESNLTEAGYMDTEISRAMIDRMFEEFVDEQPDGWLWDDRNRREELAEYTDALLGDAREEDYKRLDEEGGMPPITPEEVAEEIDIDYDEDVNRRAQEMGMSPDAIRQMDLDYDEEDDDDYEDDEMQRRMEETGMSADAIREMDAEYERDDIADVADDVDEQQRDGSPTLPSGYDPYEEYDPYNEQEEEVEHENYLIENYHDGMEEEQDMTVERQMQLQAGEMSLEEAGFGPEYDEQSALDFYDDYHVALEKFAGMHPFSLGKQTPATVAEQKALEFALDNADSSKYLADSEFGYGEFGDKPADAEYPGGFTEEEFDEMSADEPEEVEQQRGETTASIAINDALSALKQQTLNNMNQYYETEYPDNPIEGGIGDNEGIKLENIATGVQRVINAIGKNPEADPEDVALQVRKEQHNEWLRYLELEYPDTVDDYYPDGPIGDPEAIALEAEGSGIQQALREIENIDLGG